jgi:hypothetical protein
MNRKDSEVMEMDFKQGAFHSVEDGKMGGHLTDHRRTEKCKLLQLPT